MKQRVVWTVDWIWVLVLWPVLMVEAMVKLAVQVIPLTIKATVAFLRWAFTDRAR